MIILSPKNRNSGGILKYHKIHMYCLPEHKAPLNEFLDLKKTRTTHGSGLLINKFSS